MSGTGFRDDVGRVPAVAATLSVPRHRVRTVKILLVGSGAREHALARSLRRDPHVELHAAPGNPGIAQLATCHDVPGGITDPRGVADLAASLGVDLVVVGPEAPLVAGVADAVVAAGIACFGPNAAAAQLEGSKAFAKEVMAAAGVPTARAHVCADLTQVGDALDEFAAPYVVKDDGLAGGKGVVVTESREQAFAHAARCLDAGGRVVVEEFLDGPEVSLFCLCDGTDVVPLVPAQDFKRLGDGDAGPNTGGMGAYSPLDWAPAGLVEQIVDTVARPTVAQMAQRGTPFVGVLYCGLALTSAGLRVVEFNARFGDPETQVVLARLQSPLAPALMAAATGTLAELDPLQWSPQAAVTVVLAAPGYPDDPRIGGVITGVDAVTEPDDVLHAGTATSEQGDLVSAGGRVLSVVATGADLAAARDRAYAALARIDLPDSQHRSDIALAAQRGEVGAPA